MIDFKKIFKFAGIFIPALFILYLGFTLLKGISPNLFLAFTPPVFFTEETISSEKTEPEPEPDLFAEEETSTEITEIVEYTGAGGPDNMQETLDDIAEKFDILKQQAIKLIEEYNLKNNNSSNNNPEQSSDSDETPDQQQNEPSDEQPLQQQQNNPVNNIIGGGGSPNPVYSKILISEVQVAGLTDEKEEFVELYNPNAEEIDLTGWYLQKKTKTGDSYSSFVSNTLFSGKKIGANGYFTIARENSSFAGLSDIITDNSLSEDNSLILKNPNREIADKLGIGEAQEYEASPIQNPEKGQSAGRKWDATSNTEQDTDNNLIDFELQNPTPKAKNSAYMPPPNNNGSGGGGGGGPAPIVYSKILISEVRISPAEQRFVELYNPNNFEVSLTDWYLQRKTETGTSWNSFVSSPKFEGKKILANDYFLISMSAGAPDIVLDLTLTENNSLVLKNPKGDISDKLGFGSPQDFETSPAQNPNDSQSLGRIFDEISQTYLDADNNSTDFEIDAPTPRAKNIKYVEPFVEERDTTPPEVSFNLDPIQNSIIFTVNFEITDIVGTVTPSGIAVYVFQWKEEGGDWQEDAPVTVDGSPSSASFAREFTEGQNEKNYYFQIKAKDSAGNESVWLPEIPAETKINKHKKKRADRDPEP